jgi:hypothetical protein
MEPAPAAEANASTPIASAPVKGEAIGAGKP